MSHNSHYIYEHILYKLWVIKCHLSIYYTKPDILFFFCTRKIWCFIYKRFKTLIQLESTLLVKHGISSCIEECVVTQYWQKSRNESQISRVWQWIQILLFILLVSLTRYGEMKIACRVAFYERIGPYLIFNNILFGWRQTHNNKVMYAWLFKFNIYTKYPLAKAA